MADTRRDKRAPVSLKVRFKSATLDEFVEQYSADISRGGLFIKSKKPMKVGTLLKFELQLKDESRLIHGVGRVVWRREAEEASDSAPAGMGIKFIKMGNDSRTMVQQIVDTRGDSPGTFDEGSEGPKKEESFFPHEGPAELPSPEDRTQVRHASEFLAEALSEADGDAAAEAEAEAEVARKRTEEIQQERAEAEERRKAEEAAAAARIREQEEAAKAAAAAAAAAEEEEEAEDEEQDAVPPDTLPDSSAELGAADTELAGKTLGDEGEAAATVRDQPRLGTDVETERPPAPADEGSSPWLVVGLVVLIAAAIGGYLWWKGQQHPEAEEELSTDLLDPEEETIGEEIPEEEPEPTVVTVGVSANVPATVSVDGAEVGTTPVDVELAEGESSTIEVRAPGYATATQEVSASEGQAPLSFELVALPWVIVVQTDPEGARVSVAGRHGRSPARIELAEPVRESLTVAASKPGYRMSTATVEPTEFSEQDGAMVATIDLALAAHSGMAPTMTPTMMAATTETETTTTDATMEAPTMEAPTMEATMEAPTMEATMEATTMEATMEPIMDAIPDNPL